MAWERLGKCEWNLLWSGDLSLSVISMHKHVIMWPNMSDHRYIYLCNHVFIAEINAGAYFLMQCGIPPPAQRKMSPFCQNGPRESIFMWVHLRALGANLEVRGWGMGWCECFLNAGSRVCRFFDARKDSEIAHFLHVVQQQCVMTHQWNLTFWVLR